MPEKLFKTDKNKKETKQLLPLPLSSFRFSIRIRFFFKSICCVSAVICHTVWHGMKAISYKIKIGYLFLF